MFKKMASKYKLNQWKNELSRLTQEKGVSYEDICEYIGVSYNRDVGFYVKMPKKRSMYIGIGMALGRDLNEINRWITYYGMKRRLYSKDISEDLVWIYLINRNLKDAGSGVNYYKMYEECQELAFETYLNIWEDIIESSQGTSDLDRRLSTIEYSEPFKDLRTFVVNNIDSFKTAYARPRKYLRKYVNSILEINGRASGRDTTDSLSSLRGWLDDSMINYLAGSEETINVIDMKTGRRTAEIRQIPKNRKAHISLALSLGMTCNEINEYLELMGFAPLDEDSEDERYLIKVINRWDDKHPLQQVFKEKYILGESTIEMDTEDERQAVSDMLMLRQDLRDEYKKSRKVFPYLK